MSITILFLEQYEYIELQILYMHNDWHRVKHNKISNDDRIVVLTTNLISSFRNFFTDRRKFCFHVPLNVNSDSTPYYMV